MKKNDFTDIKALDIKSLNKRAYDLRGEIADLVLDKNMNALKDVKSISKKRKDLAQVLTVLKQKELLSGFESNKTEESKESKVAKESKVSKETKEPKVGKKSVKKGEKLATK